MLDVCRFAVPRSMACRAYRPGLLALLGLGVTLAGAATVTTAADADQVLATVNGQSITEAQVIAQAKSAFDTQQARYARELNILQAQYAQSRQDLLQQQLEALLDQRALALEAKARGLSPSALLATVTVPAVTDAEVRAFFDANKARSPMSYEELAPRIRAYLASQHNDEAMHDFYASLRTKYHIESRLGPYRVSVAANGPARGRADAPVTIVEFGDFQCPYCREAENTLRQVLAQHSGDTRLVFREMPIPELHPNAMVAAEAGVCADEQGKFWPMHDAMYADQSQLDLPGLKATASRLGLDSARLEACMKAPATAARIDADVQAASKLGVGGTPYFFINGRPLNGSVPPERFESIIREELARQAGAVADARSRAQPRS